MKVNEKYFVPMGINYKCNACGKEKYQESGNIPDFWSSCISMSGKRDFYCEKCSEFIPPLGNLLRRDGKTMKGDNKNG